ncbi:ATP-dependent DNA helicase RecG [compost metagenome]
MLPKAQHLPAQYLANLGFQPTGAQQRVANEIAYDLSQHEPMMRLVQGDVGAGKTVVAALAALQARSSPSSTTLPSSAGSNRWASKSPG